MEDSLVDLRTVLQVRLDLFAIRPASPEDRHVLLRARSRLRLSRGEGRDVRVVDAQQPAAKRRGNS